MNHLFVYGTLVPGRENADQLDRIPGRWRPARVRGTLHEKGWGAARGYPVIVLDPDADPVDGMLFSSPELPQHWGRLDRFEGPGYRRVGAPVELEDGTCVAAHVYVLND